MKSKFLATLICLAPFAVISAHADTLVLTGVEGSGLSNGEAVYPYYASVNGDATASVMCMDYGNDMDIGESWSATPISITLANTSDMIGYRADAIILATYLSPGNTYTAQEMNTADWSIFDPTGIAGVAEFDAAAQNLAAFALDQATNNAAAYTSDYAQFTVYIPDDTNGADFGTGDAPQRFIGVAPVAATPEPSTFVLLGSGLLGVAGSVRRRFARS